MPLTEAERKARQAARCHAYYLSHKEAWKGYAAARDPDERKAYDRARYLANKEAQKEYAAAHRVERRAGAKRRYLTSKADLTLPYDARRLLINAIKRAKGCADCGYDKHPAALDFDHRPGTVKLFNVGALGTRSEKAVLAEIAKCEVVGANCHRIRTEERRNANATL